MFSNLLRNAIKYNTKNNWYIKIELKKDSLSVANSSYWIENEDLDKIFDRFYKCEKSRNSEGFWIWLSLVKKICDIYKWKVSVNSELNKETKFEIKF
jgi:two-component system OmpR family sensor kinase